jgi:hypothetical protein
MRTTLGLQALVVVALAHFSISALADASAQPVNRLVSRAQSNHGRRSLDLGRSTRLHRARLRRTFDLPKPYGTDGAATTDEENIKLLEKYVAHQSEVNTAVSWMLKSSSSLY